MIEQSDEVLAYWVRHYGYRGEEHDCWGAWEECDEETYRSALGKAGIETRVLAATPPTPEQAGPIQRVAELGERIDSGIANLGNPDVSDLSSTQLDLAKRAVASKRAQAEQAGPSGEALAAGIEAAAKWVDQRRNDFISEYGSIDPDTGTLEFGRGAHAEAKSEYAFELQEIADGIRALASPGAMEGAPTIPPEVTAWCEARKAHAAATEAYNARARYARERDEVDGFGATPVDAEFYAMTDTGNALHAALKGMLQPLFDWLEGGAMEGAQAAQQEPVAWGRKGSGRALASWGEYPDVRYEKSGLFNIPLYAHPPTGEPT